MTFCLGLHDLVEVADEANYAADEHDQHQRPQGRTEDQDERQAHGLAVASAGEAVADCLSAATQISKLMLSRLEGQGLVENTQAVNPQCFGPSRLKTGGKTLTHPRPAGAQRNTNRGARPVPSVLQEET